MGSIYLRGMMMLKVLELNSIPKNEQRSNKAIQFED
jgi:hypothetical protein